MTSINFDFYNGSNHGIYVPLENLNPNITDILKTNPEELVSKVPYYVYFFLNPERANVYKCYDFDDNKSVLEFNSAFGEITDFLCQKCKDVKSITFSALNAEVMKERLSKYSNCEILVGMPKKGHFQNKFDCIIVNDLLEFSEFFFPHQNSALCFFEYLKSMLKENGHLLMSLSNRFGIDEWNGARSFFSKKTYDRLQDYPYNPYLNSFSEQDLKEVLGKVFDYSKILYPVPTHYNTRLLLSHEYLNSNKLEDDVFLLYKNCNLTGNEKFDSAQVMKDIYENEEFEFFANSFLIIAGAKPLENLEPYYKF